MAEFRWIKTSLFVILVLQFTAEATGQLPPSFTVRDGDEVTLPCSLIDDQNHCDSTAWLFYDSRKEVFLVSDGEIGEGAKDESDRLSVSENCSLVIKNVRDEDGGEYICKQYRSVRYKHAYVYLCVVSSEYLHHHVFKLSGQNNILKHYNNNDDSDEVPLLSLSMSPSSPVTEHNDTDEVTVTCSVLTYGRCRHTVKWLLEGQDVDKDNKDLMTSQSSCSASLKFLTSHFFHTSRFNSLMCEVTRGNKVQKFPLRISPSGDETGENTTTTTESTTTESTTTTTTTSEDDTKAGWRKFILVSVGLAALIIIVVAVNMWARIKEKKSQTDEIDVCYDAEDETVNYENIEPPDGV